MLTILQITLAVFFGGLVGTLLFTPYVRDFALRHSLIGPIGDARHDDSRVVPRLGGVAIFVPFMCTVGILFKFFVGDNLAAPFTLRAMLVILGSATLVFLIGLCDDLRSISPYWKIAVESVAAVLLYQAGFGIYRMDALGASHGLNTIVGLLLTVLWVLLITNAFNLIDGLDGLAAGSALFSTIVIFALAMLNHNYILGVVTVALAAVIFGFLRFNFYPASIFLGDSGSLFIGFLLSAFALAGSQKSTTAIAVAIPLVTFGLPILDVCITIVRRFLTRKPLFLGDSDHIHHRLLKRGLSHREAVCLLYVVSTGFGFFSLALLHSGRVIALILGATGICIWFGVRYLKYAEFSEIRRILIRFLQQRKMIANNCALQKGTELIDSCSDIAALCHILKDTLASLGIDGLSFNILSKYDLSEAMVAPLHRDANGRLWLQWKDNSTNGWSWELRFELSAVPGERSRCFSLYRLSCDQPLLVDINLLTSSFRMAIFGAITRVEGCHAAVLRQNSFHVSHECLEDITSLDKTLVQKTEPDREMALNGNVHAS